MPERRRLVIKRGSGRYAKTQVYCQEHAEQALNELREKLHELAELMQEE